MSRKNLKLVVSTDCAGLFATPKDWQKVWGFVLSHPKFCGFEMLSWGGPNSFWPEHMLKSAAKLGLPVAGIHGRTGKIRGKRSLRIMYGNVVYNETLVSTHYLLSRLALKVDYILLHNLELRPRHIWEMVVSHKENIKTLFVENSGLPDDEVDSLDQAKKLRNLGINAGVTFDLYHYFRNLEDGLSMKDKWRKVLLRLGEFIGEAEKSKLAIEIHLPMGARKDDSLPDELGVSDLRELARVVSGRIDYLGMEQQPKLSDFLFPNGESRERVLLRNKRNIDFISKAGLI